MQFMSTILMIQIYKRISVLLTAGLLEHAAVKSYCPTLNDG